MFITYGHLISSVYQREILYINLKVSGCVAYEEEISLFVCTSKYFHSEVKYICMSGALFACTNMGFKYPIKLGYINTYANVMHYSSQILFQVKDQE